MIVLQCEQGTPEWINARLGIPTASEFSKILTAKGALSTSSSGYMAKLLAEWATGAPVDEFKGTEWTERGKELEPEAFAYYQFVRGVEPQKVGFVYKDERRLVGCSPDFVVGTEGVGEIKCPAPHTHMQYLMDGYDIPNKYKAQTQGQLWVCGVQWVDFISYHPGLPEVCVRVNRDDAYIKALDAALTDFIGTMLEYRDRFAAHMPERLQG